MTPKWLQKLKQQRKIKEQEELIRVLRRPENATKKRPRPALKFANNIGSR